MSTDGITQDHLNGQSALSLVVFIIVSFFVIWPVQIPVVGVVQRSLLAVLRTTRIVDPATCDALSRRRLHFPLSLETAPVIGVLFLLATTTIDGSTIRLGVKGDENVKPYDVLVLFISLVSRSLLSVELAYIAIALDGTGALEAVAFWVSKRGGSSGRRLFAYLYAFFLLTGCIVGNDPLILSGTPFLAYLTKYTDLDPTPWIFSEFMAANTASAVLVSSNPTNILITGSFNLNYLTDFTKWTILPSVVPGILNYFLLYAMFRKRIPKTLVPLKDDPWSKLRDPKGAVFLSVLMLVTIAVLVGTSFVPGHAVDVWMVTAPAGILALTFEIVSDWINPVHQRQVIEEDTLDPAAAPIEMSTVTRKSSSPPPQEKTTTSPPSPLPSPLPPTKSETTLTPPSSRPTPSHIKEHKTLQSHLSTLKRHFPQTTRTITHLPLPLLPFAISQFILVRSLCQRSWITTFASGFSNAILHSPPPLHITASVFFFGFISAAFLCPFAGTNIGATILLVEVLRSPAFVAGARDERVLRGAVYATALGSNLGAFSCVFAASLAGLLWKGLLEGKGVRVGRARFALVNFVPLVVQTGVACAIIVGEVYWFG